MLLKLGKAGGDQQFPSRDHITTTGHLLPTVLVLQQSEKMLEQEVRITALETSLVQ